MTSLILRVAVRVLMPLLLMFSIFLLVRGHNLPGGGFSGGLVAASAWALFAIVYGAAAARRALRVDPLDLIAAGLGTILVGDDSASAGYIRMKQTKAAELGLTSPHIHLGQDATQADVVVVAVPWRAVARVLAESLRSLLPGLRDLPRLEPAPITAVHFWYDRPVLPLPHAVLVDRLSQWIFHHETSTTGAGKNRSEHHYQVVISASRDLIGRDREKAVAQIRAELSEIWPAFNAARLLRWRMVTNPEAVFSLGPGIDPIRPAQQTAIPNLVLAGDWTATGWPATRGCATCGCGIGCWGRCTTRRCWR